MIIYEEKNVCTYLLKYFLFDHNLLVDVCLYGYSFLFLGS